MMLSSPSAPVYENKTTSELKVGCSDPDVTSACVCIEPKPGYLLLYLG